MTFQVECDVCAEVIERGCRYVSIRGMSYSGAPVTLMHAHTKCMNDVTIYDRFITPFLFQERVDNAVKMDNFIHRLDLEWASVH